MSGPRTKQAVEKARVRVVDGAPQRGQRDAGNDLREEIDRAEKLPALRLAGENDGHQHGERDLDKAGYQRPDDVVDHRTLECSVPEEKHEVFEVVKRGRINAVPFQKTDNDNIDDRNHKKDEHQDQGGGHKSP